MHCGDRGAVPRCDNATYVDMLFVRYREAELYAGRLASIIGSNLSLIDDAPATNMLDNVAFTRPYGTLHFLTNLDY